MVCPAMPMSLTLEEPTTTSAERDPFTHPSTHPRAQPAARLECASRPREGLAPPHAPKKARGANEGAKAPAAMGPHLPLLDPRPTNRLCSLPHP